MRRYPDGRFIDLSNQMDWTYHFLQKYLQGTYPIHEVNDHMLLQKGIYIWSTDPDNSVWKEGKALFDFSNGISICKQKKDHCETFCFYGKNSDTFLTKFLLKSIPLLEQFFRYFIDNMGPYIETAYQHNDVLLTPNIYMNSTENFYLYDQEQAFLQEICKDKITLTVREKECIMLAAYGRTAKEIARYLNISQRTVETHFVNARDKWACKNTKELIAKVAFGGIDE